VTQIVTAAHRHL